MNPFERFVQIDDRLPGFQLSPQCDGAPLKPAHLRPAIVFDHPLNGSERIAGVAGGYWHHPDSVRPTAKLKLFPIAQRGVEPLAILVADVVRLSRKDVMMTKDTTTSRDQDVHKGAVEDDLPTKATNAPALDGNGLPKDTKKIAEEAVAARADGTTG